MSFNPFISKDKKHIPATRLKMIAYMNRYVFILNKHGTSFRKAVHMYSIHIKFTVFTRDKLQVCVLFRNRLSLQGIMIKHLLHVL